MKIYDSLTQTTKNLPENKITIYNCGPTVYNYVHIGNIRPLITFDVLYNYLKLSKKSVQYAHNLTDVDDKIIKRAKEEKTTELAVSEKYGQAYLELIKELNANLMDFIPKVTENIEGIIGYVQQLVQADAGYEAQNGDVYFSIDKVKNIYGQLSKQNVDNLIQDARKEIDVSEKKNPLDFVL
jgi:cysteinyl-tRNA synthetase